jgi:hypothetical protein
MEKKENRSRIPDHRNEFWQISRQPMRRWENACRRFPPRRPHLVLSVTTKTAMTRCSLSGGKSCAFQKGDGVIIVLRNWSTWWIFCHIDKRRSLAWTNATVGLPGPLRIRVSRSRRFLSNPERSRPPSPPSRVPPPLPTGMCVDGISFINDSARDDRRGGPFLLSHSDGERSH